MTKGSSPVFLRDNFLDEKALLRSRVAELEGVIREVASFEMIYGQIINYRPIS